MSIIINYHDNILSGLGSLIIIIHILYFWVWRWGFLLFIDWNVVYWSFDIKFNKVWNHYL